MAAQMALPEDCQPNGNTARPSQAPLERGGTAEPPKEVTRPTISAVPSTLTRQVTESQHNRVHDVAETGVSRGVQRVTSLAVGVVAVVAVMVSYDHQRQLAAMAGEGWRAWLIPLSVDGLVVAASMAMLVRHRNGERGGLLAWSALLLGLGASLAANVAAANPTPVGRVVAGWPPVALLLAYELLMQQIRRGSGAGVQTVRAHDANQATNPKENPQCKEEPLSA